MSHSHPSDQFVELLRHHRGQLFGYIYALLHNLHDTEDVYQDACLVLWAKFDQYRPGSSFVNWACEVARLEVLNFLRKRSRSKTSFSTDLQIELASLQSKMADEGDGSQAYQDALAGCLGKLSKSDQQLVRECYSAENSFKQVAESIGRTPKSVYDALGRIRKALLDCVTGSLARQDSPRPETL